MRRAYWWLAGGVAVVLAATVGTVVLVNLSPASPRPTIELRKITDADEKERFAAASEAARKLAGGDRSVLLPGITLDLSKLLPSGPLTLDPASWKRAGRGASVDGKAGGRPVRVILVVTDDGWRVVDVRPPLDQPSQPDQPQPTPSGPPSAPPSSPTKAQPPALAASQCDGVKVAKGAKAGPTPVLLVPGPDGVAGLTATAGTAAVAGAPPVDNSLVGRFAEIPGVTAYVVTKGDGSQWVGDRTGVGPAVADAIDCLSKAGKKIAIVAASTGGLAVKWALTGDRAKSVGVVATLGTPYGGAYAVDAARVLRTDDPSALPASDAGRNGVVLQAALADLAACPKAGGTAQHTEPACRRLDTLAALAGSLGNSLKPGAVAGLPDWPAGVPVLQIAARAKVGQVDVGDGIATTDSALSGANRKTIHTCANTKPAAAAPIRCWNSDLPVLTEAVDDAVGAIRAYVHPTVTAFSDQNTATVLENGKVSATLPATQYGYGSPKFSADGRYLVAGNSTGLAVLDIDTGARKSVACGCDGLVVVGRQAYVAAGVTSHTIDVYDLPDLRKRPSGFGEFGKPGASSAHPRAAYGEQVIIDVLDDAPAANGTPTLVAVGPDGVRSKVVALPEPGYTTAVATDPYDPTGPVIVENRNHYSACSNFASASIVNFAAGTRKDVDGKAFGAGLSDTGYVDFNDLHRAGDGRYYALVKTGTCDEELTQSEAIPWSLWRLDGARWVSVDAGITGADRYFGAAGRLTVATKSSTEGGTLQWKQGSQTQSYNGVRGLSSPPGTAIFTDPTLAPPAGRKITPPQPLIATADGIGPLRVGASLEKLQADGVLAVSSPLGVDHCGALDGKGRLQATSVITRPGETTLKAVSVSATKFGTDAGLPPNATVAQLRKVYGSALQTIVIGTDRETRYYVTKGPNIVLFYVNGQNVTGYALGEKESVFFRANLGGLC